MLYKSVFYEIYGFCLCVLSLTYIKLTYEERQVKAGLPKRGRKSRRRGGGVVGEREGEEL